MNSQLLPLLSPLAGYGDAEALRCPACGTAYTHLESVEPIDGYDGRLDALLTFTCEGGEESERQPAAEHRFGIRVRQHKGLTTLAVEYLVGLRPAQE